MDKLKRKLEIALCSYLPYELVFLTDKKRNITATMHPLTMGNLMRGDAKPILHPLSDLTKEIEHNGEKFVPMEKLQYDIFNVEDYYDWRIIYEQLNEAIMVAPFEIVQKLFEWHFNVFNLPKDLWVDINSLTTPKGDK